jgi:hypothetical protein
VLATCRRVRWCAICLGGCVPFATPPIKGEIGSATRLGGHGAAAKLRIDTELFKSGVSDFDSDDKCGNSSGRHYGTTAIGVFVEAGRTWAPEMSGGNAWVATAGLTIRLPSAVGVWIGIPWCK